MFHPSIGPAAPPRRPLRLACWALAALAFVAPGCSRGTQLSSENRELVASLATAVSTREPKWLAENSQQVEKRRAEGRCTESEYAALREIIEKAEKGEWDAAQEAAYALRDAQEPNAEDYKKLEERRVSHEPKHIGPRAKPVRKP